MNGGVGLATLSASNPDTATITSPSSTAGFLPGGSYSVTARYAGDDTFSSSASAGVPVVVNKENSRLQYGIVTFDPATNAITSTNATTFAYGSPYILRFDILNSTGSACQAVSVANGGTGTTAGCAFDATGTVTITDNGIPLDAGTFPVNSGGSGEDQPIQLGAGTHPLTASYTGDISYNAAGPVTNTLTVTKAVTATGVVPSATSIVSGSGISFTANVTTNSNGAGPTGTVVFMNGSTALSNPQNCVPVAATSTTAASCSATLTTTLSFLAPPSILEGLPRVPSLPVWIVTGLLLLAFIFSLRYLPAGRRRPAFACLMLVVLLMAGTAGCGGGSGGGGGGANIRSITAVYSGDANYAGSTSVAVSITIQ